MTVLLSVLGAVTVVWGTALMLAGYARLPWRWTQFIAPTFTGWIPATFGAVSLVLGDLATFYRHDLPRKFSEYPTVATFLVTVAGGLAFGLIVLPIVGLWRRRVAGVLVPIAAQWPILKLLAAGMASAVLFAASIVVSDVLLRSRIAEKREISRETIERLRSRTIADEQDAAPILREAYSLVGDKDQRPVWWDASVEAGLDVNAPEVAEYLAAHGRSVELARAASHRPAAWFTWRPNAELGVDDSDEYEIVITVGRFLYLTALQRATAGDARGCVECLDALRRLARQEISPSTMIWSMVQMGLERSRLKAIEGILASGALKASGIESPMVADTHSYRPAMRAALKLQGATDMELLCRVMTGEISNGALDGEPEPPSGPGQAISLMLARVWITSDDLNAFPAFVADVREHLQSPPGKSPSPYERLFDFDDAPVRGTMTRMLGYTLGAVVQQVDRTDLTLRLADVGLALAEFQSRHATLPAKLDDLVPEFIDRVPLSPYDGQPLRLSPDGAGFVVHAGEFADLDFDQDPTLCLGESYRLRRVEPAREDAARFGP